MTFPTHPSLRSTLGEYVVNSNLATFRSAANNTTVCDTVQKALQGRNSTLTKLEQLKFHSAIVLGLAKDLAQEAKEQEKVQPKVVAAQVAVRVQAASGAIPHSLAVNVTAAVVAGMGGGQTIATATPVQSTTGVAVNQAVPLL